jgi:hypothetical protein
MKYRFPVQTNDKTDTVAEYEMQYKHYYIQCALFECLHLVCYFTKLGAYNIVKYKVYSAKS